MRVTLEISDFEEMEKLLSFFKTLKVNDIKIVSKEIKPNISKGDKSLNPKDLIGIWKNHPKNIEEIRTNAWSRKA